MPAVKLQSYCTSSSMKFQCRMFWHKNGMKYLKKKKNPKSYLYTRIMIESVKSLYNQFKDRAELYSIKYHDKIKM